MSARLAEAMEVLTATLPQGEPCHGIGVDLVEVATVERHMRVAGDRYARKMLRPKEIAFCANEPARVASRIAAKEAAAKALGTGMRSGVRWIDIEIVRAADGAPSVRLHRGAAARAMSKDIAKIHISLCHEGGYAAAIAVAIATSPVMSDIPRSVPDAQIGDRLRAAREYLGLSQSVAADAIGVPRPSISMMESGQRKVSAEELRKFSKLYRKSYEYLLGDEPELPENAGESVTALFRAAKDLTENDRMQVLRFAEFLRNAGPPPALDGEDQS